MTVRFHTLSLLLLSALLTCSFTLPSSVADADTEDEEGSPITVGKLTRSEPVSFASEVLPILRRNCLACHNASDAAAELNLETPQAMKLGGDSGPALVPGDADASLLLAVATHRDEPIMPPEGNDVRAKNLTPQELGLLKLWIDQGASGEATTDAPAKLSLPPKTLHPVYAVTMTEHGDFVAAGRANQIQVYHVPTARQVATLRDPALKDYPGGAASSGTHSRTRTAANPPAHIDSVQALAASSDGQTIASGGYRNVKLWRRLAPHQIDGTDEKRLESHDEFNLTHLQSQYQLDTPAVFARAFREGDAIAAIGKDGSLRLLDSKSKQQRLRLATSEIERRTVTTVKRTVAVALRQVGWLQYDRKQVGATLKRAEQKVKSLSTQLEELIAAGTKPTEEKYQKAVETLAFRATDLKDLTAAVALAEQAITDKQAEVAELKKQLEAAENAVTSAVKPFTFVAFSLDGNTIAAADAAGTIHTFALSTGSPIDRIATGETSEIESIIFRPNGRLTVRFADDTPVQDWQTGSWILKRTIGSAVPGTTTEADTQPKSTLADRVTALAFSPDGKLLATGSGMPARSGELKLWDVATGRLVREFKTAHSDAVLGLEFSRDGVYLASGSADRTLRVFRVNDGEQVASFEYHTNHVLGVSWRYDNRVLASSGADNMVRVWNFKTGNEHKSVKRFGDKEVTGIRFLGNSGNFVVSTADGAVSRWDYNGGGGKRYDGPAGFIYSIATDGEGTTIAAGGHNGAVYVWDREGKRLATFE